MGVGVSLGLIAVGQIANFISPFPTPLASGKLKTTGAFALTRHPIYTAILLVALGFSVYQASLYKFLVFISLVILFYFKSKYEENLLRKKYSNYKDYQLKTGLFLPKLIW